MKWTHYIPPIWPFTAENYACDGHDLCTNTDEYIMVWNSHCPTINSLEMCCSQIGGLMPHIRLQHVSNELTHQKRAVYRHMEMKLALQAFHTIMQLCSKWREDVGGHIFKHMKVGQKRREKIKEERGRGKKVKWRNKKDRWKKKKFCSNRESIKWCTELTKIMTSQ